MTAVTKQVAGEVLATVAQVVLSKFRRKWLERQAGERVYIADGRESARLETINAAEREAELERIAHERRNTEQARLLKEEAERTAAKARAENQAPTAGADGGAGNSGS